MALRLQKYYPCKKEGKINIKFYVILFLILAALICIIMILRTTPVKHMIYYKLGKNAYAKKKFERAKKIFQKVMDLRYNLIEGKFMFASACFGLEEYDTAKENFESIIKVKPRDYGTLYNLGLTLQMQNKPEEALEYYNKALKVKNNDPDAYYRIGTVYFEYKEYEKAAEFLEKARGLAPNRSDVMFYINRCVDEMCNYNNDESAQNVLQEYLRLSVFSELPPDFNLVFARAYAKAGKIEQSIEQCKKSFAINASNGHLYTLMGALELVTKNFQSARDHLHTAISLLPKKAENYQLLAYVFLNLENYEGYKKYKERYKQLIS